MPHSYVTDQRLLSWKIFVTFLTSLTVNNVGHFQSLKLSIEMFAVMKAKRKLTVERLETELAGKRLVLLHLRVRSDDFLTEFWRVVRPRLETEVGDVEGLGQLLQTLSGDLLAGGSRLEELQQDGESPRVGVGEDEGGGDAGREGENTGERGADQPQEVGGNTEGEEPLLCHH